SVAEYAVQNRHLQRITIQNIIMDEESLATVLQIGQEFASRFKLLRPSFPQLTLQDLSVITDHFTSLVEILVPLRWMSLAQITGCLAKLPHLRSVGLVVYAREDYFRLHQLQNDQAPPVVTMPGVTRL